MTDRPAGRRYRGLVVAMFALVYVLYTVDRSAMTITQEMIKQEFGLSDTAMGLLTGTFYGISYALAGLPLGWLADRTNRKRLLVGVVAVWSGLTALSGLCHNFVQLALARIGVGAAEAGGAPPALSILSDLFPPERRGTVTSIFFAGAGIGGILSFLLGGYIAQNFGWRAVFLSFGLPGLVVAGLLLAIVREPERAAPVVAPSAPARRHGGAIAFLADCWRTLRQPGLPWLYFASGLYMLSLAGVGTWTVPFFTRTFGLEIATVGLLLGFGNGVCSVIGSIGTGVIFDWARRFGPRGPLLVVAAGVTIHFGAGLIVLLSGHIVPTVIALCFMGATSAMHAGPTTAAISELAPAQSRGLGFALYTVVSNVVGAGLGPLVIGMLSDSSGGGAGGLRDAMLTVMLVEVLVIFTYVRASAAFARHRVTAP